MSSSSLPEKRGPQSMPVSSLDFNQLRRRVHELLDQSFEEPFSGYGRGDWSSDFSPSVDVDEKKDAYEVRAELPGVNKENVDVSMQDNTLVIRGEKRSECSEEKEGYRHTECSFGSFYRTIPLTAEVNEKEVKAEFKDGVLKVTLPKSAEAESRRKKIPLT